MLKPAVLFQNYMILQREKNISIWGNSKPKETVTISIQGQTVTGTADDNGRGALL